MDDVYVGGFRMDHLSWRVRGEWRHLVASRDRMAKHASSK
ncbi:hypothetical protein A2U01_0099444, partial [Trifolium medium]|nr:hypothetical protein [Trifolium medium]